jgi:hypothetical protein
LFFFFVLLLSQALEAAKSGLVLFHEAMGKFLSQALEAAKSGLVRFHQAMGKFGARHFEECFQRFERAAAKGHEESIWVLSVVKDVKMEMNALKEAFAKTEEPLGWYFAGQLSQGRLQFDFFKKSAEGGCSWGQAAYVRYFRDGSWLVVKDEKVYVEWLEKAANQNNPLAMHWLGDWFQWKSRGNDKEKSLSYFRGAAELGWKDSMQRLAVMFRDGKVCEKDLRQAVIWSAKGDSDLFWNIMYTARAVFEDGRTEDLDCDFNQLCYALGWGFYWYHYCSCGSNDYEFSKGCLDHYFSCVELQKKSIFTFLLCWNRTTGVKPPGQMIAEMVWEMVWEGREDNLVKAFEQRRRKSTRLKRIKK